MAHVVVEDRIEAAERFRRRKQAKEARSAAEHDPFESVTVRVAGADDALALRGLSERDGRAAPVAPVLLAEVDGVLLAARSIEDGASVADPFRHTSHLSELLALRATHLRNAELGLGAAGHPLRSTAAWLKGHTLHS
jgi:hypothetical protein